MRKNYKPSYKNIKRARIFLLVETKNTHNKDRKSYKSNNKHKFLEKLINLYKKCLRF